MGGLMRNEETDLCHRPPPVDYENIPRHTFARCFATLQCGIDVGTSHRLILVSQLFPLNLMNIYLWNAPLEDVRILEPFFSLIPFSFVVCLLLRISSAWVEVQNRLDGLFMILLPLSSLDLA